MSNIQPFSLKEYYLWRKKEGVQTLYPWQRQYFNIDCLEYEIKRINELFEWRKKFRKAENNAGLDSVSFYAVPMEIHSSWEATIATYGVATSENYNYIGLSALFNDPQALVFAILPYTIKQPQEYRLIEITKSKKINLVNEKLNMVEPVLIIEDWDYLKSDYIYVDVPYEKGIVQKVLKENLTLDEQVSLSFQSPIISAPYVSGSIGGVSLSSMVNNSEFAKDLVKTMELMVPPEYRTLMPPKSVYRGHQFQYLKGIKFHLAERPHYGNNILSGIYSKRYDKLDKELLRRDKFNGEFSIFSTINPVKGNVSQIWKTMMGKFTDTEITLPRSIDELMPTDGFKAEYVDSLAHLRNAINEDLWLQVVYSRQYMPGMNTYTAKDFVNIINLLEKDFDTRLADIHKDEKSREYLVRSILPQSKNNIKRIAQSLARSDEKEQLSSEYFKKARGIILDNFTGFIENIDTPEFGWIKSKMEKKKKENARYSVVQTHIINNPYSTTLEIYETVKSEKLFKDIYDLQGLLDWLVKHKHVIKNRNTQYVWVGVGE